MAKKITREEEALIPAFQSRREALRWFRDKYGDDFRWVSTEVSEDGMYYFCALILNKEEYEAGVQELQYGDPFAGTFDGRAFLESFQQIEIYKGGRIHIVH